MNGNFEKRNFKGTLKGTLRDGALKGTWKGTKKLNISRKGKGKQRQTQEIARDRRAENKRQAMDASQPPRDRLYLSLSPGGWPKHETTKKGN